jgi:hypothetical protein
MSCDPFGNMNAIVADNWHNKKRRKVHLQDGKSHPFVAIYERLIKLNAFIVDKGLLKELTGNKMCDVLLLKCPTIDKKKIYRKDGTAYFIEMKTQNDIPKAYKQLKESFERLNAEYSNWMTNYKVYYFRVCFKSTTTNIIDSSHYRALMRKIPKGIREEEAIKIDNFATNPELIK